MSAQPNQPFVEFDEETHSYFVDGKRIRFSVTEVLTLANYINPRWFTDEQRQRGTDVHRITAEIDEAGKCDLRKVPRHYRGYIKAWESYKRRRGVNFSVVEQIVTCPELDYAGRFDRVISEADEIIDLKTNVNGSIYSWTRLQLVAYGHALNPRHMWKRRVVCLRPNGEYNTQIYPVLNWQADLAEFFRALEKAKGATDVLHP